MIKIYTIYYVYLDCDITYYLFIQLTYFYKLIVLNVQTNVQYLYMLLLFIIKVVFREYKITFTILVLTCLDFQSKSRVLMKILLLLLPTYWLL